MSSAETVQVKLLEKKVWREGLVSLRFEKPEGLRFMPGQFLRIGCKCPDSNNIENEVVFRPYSLASLPTDPYVEFFIVGVPGGQLSGRLVNLEAGDSVFMDMEIWGQMIPERIAGGTDLWCFASGTGLAPFISVLRNESEADHWKNFIIVHSVRSADDLAYVKLFSALRDRFDTDGSGRTLTYVPVVTREATQFLSQRVPQLLESGLLEDTAQRTLDAEHSRVLLCGNPDMVKEIRNLLKSRGFKSPRRGEPGNLLAENLW